MMWMVDSPWLVVVVALLAAPAIALAPRRAAWLAPLGAGVAPLMLGLMGWGALQRTAVGPSEVAPWTSVLATSGTVPWFAAADSSLTLGWAVDSLAAVMALVVAVVALCVVLFSSSYMRGDQGWARYFALISLFVGSMTMLVIGDGFLTLFVGWELVGACSYLLIGFWHQKPSAAAAAVKAFLTTRVGDVGMLLGLAILWWLFGTLDYVDVVVGVPTVPGAWIGFAGVLIAIGAMGKSAQFPLHAWLPDAMEGPTPVSALIHAATMVAAGVYVVARAWPLFDVAPVAQSVLLGAGLVSAVGAAVIATAQRDIKKVLAYSTISQLGFMFAALGVGAWTAAFFHLVTHAGFKALLFLGSGSVIHGAHTQDIYEMGGVRKSMPWTAGAWFIGALALAGLPGLSGFFSKDQVIESVMHHHWWAGVVLLVSAALTAFYMARTTRLVFFGSWRGDSAAHEGDASLVVPLGVLSLVTIGVGWAGASLFSSLGQHIEPLAMGVTAAAVGSAAVGGFLGWLVGASVETDRALVERMGQAGRLIQSGFGWDRLIDKILVGPTTSACRALWAFGDRLVVDGAVSLAARAATRIGAALSAVHNGDAQRYATVIAATVAVLLAAAAMMGRWG